MQIQMQKRIHRVESIRMITEAFKHLSQPFSGCKFKTNKKQILNYIVMIKIRIILFFQYSYRIFFFTVIENSALKPIENVEKRWIVVNYLDITQNLVLKYISSIIYRCE